MKAKLRSFRKCYPLVRTQKVTEKFVLLHNSCICDFVTLWQDTCSWFLEILTIYKAIQPIYSIVLKNESNALISFCVISLPCDNWSNRTMNANYPHYSLRKIVLKDPSLKQKLRAFVKIRSCGCCLPATCGLIRKKRVFPHSLARHYATERSNKSLLPI